MSSWQSHCESWGECLIGGNVSSGGISPSIRNMCIKSGGFCQISHQLAVGCCLYSHFLSFILQIPTTYVVRRMDDLP